MNASHKKDGGRVTDKFNHESRITRLEVVMENINTTLVDIRHRIDVMDHDMKKGFESVNDRFESVNNRFESMNNKIDSTFTSLNNKIDSTYTALNNKIDSTYTALNNKIDYTYNSLNNRLWANFIWMIGGFSAILVVMAHALHWI